MPKKTVILIVILATITLGLLFLAVSQNKKLPEPKTTILPTQKVVQKTAKVFFNPQNIDISASSTQTTVDLMVDTGGSEITGVQPELQFDPKAIANVKLLPAADASGFFGAGANVLFNDVNATSGRISFVIAISPSAQPKKGIGKIATISFTRAPGTQSAQTQINILEQTLVSVLGANESALKEASPLNISLGSTTAPSSTILPTR